ncbi:MAG: hypothetical protein K5923_05845 [Clostridia bacterium]|nr:hypothetical protein [Clostridia bacterium]
MGNKKLSKEYDFIWQTAIVIAVFAIVIIAIAIPANLLYTNADTIDVSDIPVEYKITNDKNYFEYDAVNFSPSFASAYLLRSLKIDAKGNDVIIQEQFGMISPNAICSLFKKCGFNALSYNGTLDSLKKRLTNGIPIIVYMTIQDQTQYVVLKGYDEEYIYLADSVLENINEVTLWYNRKITISEFERLWKTDSPLKDNLYIVVEKE